MNFLNSSLITAVSLFYLNGCGHSEFSIYRELQLNQNDIANDNYTDFLKGLIVNGVSYSDDRLTPDLSDGKLFGDANISKVEITSYFKYTPNKTFDHQISIFVDINPKMVKYAKAYIDEELRIAQIKNYKPPVIVYPKMRVAKKENSDDLLPKSFLPPKLPNLSIGVDTPVLPEL